MPLLTLDEVKAAGNRRMFDVLAALGIKERDKNGSIVMCNPVVKDRNPSFAIWTKGGIIAFKDFRGIAQGDIIDLVAYLRGWSAGNDKQGRDQALAWLADFCGLRRLPAHARAKLASTARVEQKQAQKKQEEDAATAQGQAFKIWIDAKPIVDPRENGPGLSPVYWYLKMRGIDLMTLPRGPRGGLRLPDIVRHLPEHWHREAQSNFDCMVAGCVDYRDEQPHIKAIHRTWLLAGAKAPVEPVKKVWPSFAGLVIPLWRGDSNLSPREAAANGLRETLVLTEGIEDGLSAVVANPAYRTWAMISLSNMANIPLPECIDSVIVHRQSEWNNPQAVAAFERGKAALEAQGRTVAEVTAMSGKDLNDTLRG